MKFEFDTSQSKEDRLSYHIKDLKIRYTITNCEDHTELFIMSGEGKYSNDAILDYVCKKHDINSEKVIGKSWDNMFWRFYEVPYNWKSHKALTDRERNAKAAKHVANLFGKGLKKLIGKRK